MATKLLLVLMLLSVPATSRADLITFLNLNENPLAAGAHTEGLFTYQRSAGTGWSIVNFAGNPASSLDSTAPVGSTIDVFLTAGGLFRFNSFDTRCIFCDLDLPGDFINVIGSNGGTPTNIFTNFSNGINSFSTTNSPTNALFDRLQFRISFVGTARLLLDNINLTPIRVPEPGSVLMLLSGLVGFWGLRFSRGRR